MSPTPERQNQGVESQEELKRQISLVKEQTEKEVEEARQVPAKSDELKKQLRDQLLGSIKSAAKNAIEAYAASKSDPSKQKPEDQQKQENQNKRNAIRGIARVLAAVSKDLFTTQELPQKNQDLLKTLDQKLAEIPTAFFLQPILEKIFEKPEYVSFTTQKGSQPSEFERDIQNLTQDDPESARKLKEAIVDTVKQKGTLANLNEETAKVKFADANSATKETKKEKVSAMTKSEYEEFEPMAQELETALSSDPEGFQRRQEIEAAAFANSYPDFRRALQLLSTPLTWEPQMINRFFDLYKKYATQGSVDSGRRMSDVDRGELALMWKQIDGVKQNANELRKNEIENAIDNRDVDKMKQLLGWSDERIVKYFDLEAKTVRLRSPILDREALQAQGLTPNDLKYLTADFIYARFNDFFSKDESGKLHLTAWGKKMIIKHMYEATNKALSRVSATTLSKYNELFDPLANRVRSIIGEHLIALPTGSALTSRLEGHPAHIEFIEFAKSLFLEYNDENELRQHYHEIKVSVLTNKADAKALSESAKKFPASQREAMLNGYHPALIQMAITIFERYLQEKIAKNKNMIPTDLFASLFSPDDRLHTPDLLNVKARLIEKVEGIQKDPELRKLANQEKASTDIKEIMEVSPWEIDRALSIAIGFSLSDSARMEEILAMASKRPGGDFTGQIAIAENFSILHKWRISRGRDVESGSGFKTDELFELLIDMDANDKSLISSLKNKWVPKDWYDKADPAARRGLDEIFADLDESLQKNVKIGDKKQITFHEALKTFNRYGIFSVAGWRFSGFNSYLNGQVDAAYKEGKENPEGLSKDAFKYKWVREHLGVGTLWIVGDGARAEGDAKELLFEQIAETLQSKGFRKMEGKGYWASAVESLGETEAIRIYNNYLKRDSKDSETKILHVDGHHMSITDFVDEKKRVYRGLNFQGLLERSPYDFMINMMQLEPELADVIKLSKGSANRTVVTAYEFYFDDSLTKELTPDEIKKRDKYRMKTLRRWADTETKVTEHNFQGLWEKDDNIAQLAKVGNTWHKMFMRHADIHKESGMIRSINKDAAIKEAQEVMTLAAEKVKLKEKYAMDKSDLVNEITQDEKDKHIAEIREQYKDDPAVAETEITKYLTKLDDEINKENFYYNLFIGDKGLIEEMKHIGEKMNQLEDKFGSLDGMPGSLGARKFFYTLAYRWYDVDARDILPNSNDMKQIPMFQQMAKAGEETFSRLWGDVAKINDVLNQLVTLDNILLDVAVSGKMEKIYAIHKAIQEVEGTIGIETAHKWNYILGTVVSRFFQEDYRSRLPWPLGAIPTIQPKHKSLSTLHGGNNAMTWKEEDIRKYAHHLWAEGWLGEKGKWSKDMLEKQLGAGIGKYLLMHAIPSLTAIGFFTIGINIVSSAFSEELGGKK